MNNNNNNIENLEKNKEIEKANTNNIIFDKYSPKEVICRYTNNISNLGKKKEDVICSLRCAFRNRYYRKLDNRNYKILRKGMTLSNEFQFEIQDLGTKEVLKTVQFRIEDDAVYLTNFVNNKEYKIEYEQDEKGNIVFKNTITGNNNNNKITEAGLFHIMDKYSNFNGNLNDPIKKTFEELEDLHLSNKCFKVQQGLIKKIIDEHRTLIEKVEFTEHESEEDLYYAHIDGNTLFVDTKNKNIIYNKGNIEFPSKNPKDLILNLDEKEIKLVKFDEDNNQFESFTCLLNEQTITKNIVDKDTLNKVNELKISEAFDYTEEIEGNGNIIYTPDGSNAKIREIKYNENNKHAYEFIKDPNDIYSNTTINSIKMNCNTFLKSIEFNCDINGEKKNIIMEVNKNTNEREYFYVNNSNNENNNNRISKNNKIKIEDINIVNNIENQVKNFQLSFYDYLYKGYREKYQTNFLPIFQRPIENLLFALNTNYRFENKIIVSKYKELKQQIENHVKNIMNCIGDMEINNKTTCYVPFGNESHATLLRIKKYVENGKDKYSFVLYNSGEYEKLIKPFFDKENEIGGKVSKLLAKELNIDEKNINMEYKENIEQRDYTCVMNSAFMAFMKDSADNLKNKYKQLQLKKNKLENWKESKNHQKYKEEKDKMKYELFNLHEFSNIVLKYHGEGNRFKWIYNNKTKEEIKIDKNINNKESMLQDNNNDNTLEQKGLLIEKIISAIYNRPKHLIRKTLNKEQAKQSLEYLISKIMFPDNSFGKDNIHIDGNDIYIGTNIKDSIDTNTNKLKHIKENNFTGIHIKSNREVYFYENGILNKTLCLFGAGIDKLLTLLNKIEHKDKSLTFFEKFYFNNFKKKLTKQKIDKIIS